MTDLEEKTTAASDVVHRKGANVKQFPIVLLLIACSAGADIELPPGDRDGQVHNLDNGNFVAWDSIDEQWLAPKDFWQSFAARERGRIWPSDTEFPPYAEVNEHDTFLYQLDSGPCLMYFFHTRWRRANDVWRWGDEFNEFAGCPDVFK